MIKNYLKIAWRNLLKHKSFSIINILGLAAGIAACTIIFLYVHNEMSFDQYNAHADRIARITATIHAPESDVVLATSPAPLAAILQRDYPEIASVVRFELSPQVVKLNNVPTREERFFKADQTAFSIFSFDFTEGSAAGALQNPHSIVITAAIARKYFGAAKALGQTMICNGQNTSVTGVVKDRPANSDLYITALLSHDFSKETAWMDDFSVFTFVLFNSKPPLKDFAKKLAALSAKYVQPELNAMGATNYKAEFELQPLATLHFAKEKLGDSPKGNRQSGYIFSLLAIFILIIALLNYINLSTAKSAERAKEVGIRKVSGAFHFQLIRQFLFESFFIISISWIVAIALVAASLPLLNRLLETTIAVNWPQTVLFMTIIFFITFLLAGLYPAFILSSFKPVKVLKAGWSGNGKGRLLRKIVTVTQFAIAAALITATTVIYSQMKFIQQKDLGFSKNQLLNIYLPRDSALQVSVKAFQHALRQRPEVTDLTVGSGMIEDGMSMSTTFVQSGGKRREVMGLYFNIDPHFLPVFGMRLQEGRNLSDSFGTDKKQGFLVNEAFVKSMGWKTGLNQPIEGFDHKGTVVGVVKNFYFRSLRTLVEPLIMVYNNNPINTTTVRIKPVDLPVIKNVFKQYFPAVPLDYNFFDEIIDKQYKQDRITMSLFGDFTILAIFVSCLGLYGLVALIAVQRSKEISIRKVLGASIKQLLSLMARDFVQLAFLAMVIALPIAGFVMHRWLGSYAYHIQLGWWIFLIPIMLLLLITLAVISKEIIKTALINPIKSLRTE